MSRMLFAWQQLLRRSRECEAALLRAVHGDDAGGNHVGVRNQIRHEFVVCPVSRAAGCRSELSGNKLGGHLAYGKVNALLRHLADGGAEVRKIQSVALLQEQIEVR